MASLPSVAALQPFVCRLTRGRWSVARLAKRVGVRRLAPGCGFRALALEFRLLGT